MPYGCTLSQSYTCQGRVDYVRHRAVAEPIWCRDDLVEAANHHRLLHFHIGCIKSVLAPSKAVEMCMDTALGCYTCQGRGQCW
jgi:hypothetical protein